jgi:long-chain fatty acid transport protein
VDARYLNYSGTDGYEDGGFDPTGAFAGLGWKDVYGVSAGTQYQMTDAASVRVGYSYNTNPISDSQSFFNVGSPLIIQHGANVGASYNLTSSFKVSIAYSHFFENSVSGPIYAPGFGAVPGTNIRSTASADSVLIGASFNY